MITSRSSARGLVDALGQVDDRPGEADLRLPPGHPLGHLGTVENLEAEAHVRIVGAEALDELGQVVLPRDGGGGDGHRPLHLMGERVDGLHRAGAQAQNLLGVVVEQVPQRRRDRSPWWCAPAA